MMPIAIRFAIRLAFGLAVFTILWILAGTL
jgi:hypothetical protein